MYEILNHNDHVKAVKENHNSNLSQVYSLNFQRAAVSISVLLLGAAAFIAACRF